ncbi:MAG: hypothetical protein KDD33_03550 [Bdellovibrionales bacterium]|nr:hypothetical protein [Bdellovibrionales bacterium]
MSRLLPLIIFSSFVICSSTSAIVPMIPNPVASDVTETDEGEFVEFTDVDEPESFESLVIKVKSCRCSSGCGFSMKNMSKTMRNYVAAAKKKGSSPISCFRAQSCQDRLRRCYNRCGMKGRAARKSAHSSGRACDFPRKHQSRLRSVRRRYGIRELIHKRSHGGGLHHSH